MANNKTYSSCRHDGVPPSNTPLSSDCLKAVKDVKFKPNVPFAAPRNLEHQVWKGLVDEFRVKGAIGLDDTDLKAFAVVLNEQYAYEVDFDEELFLALRERLFRHGLAQAPREPDANAIKKANKAGLDAAEAETVAKRIMALEPIVFNNGLFLPKKKNDPMYAVGIARQSNGERSSSTETSTEESSNSGLAPKSRLDHCSCLLEQTERGGEWKVAKIFSVVELKIGGDAECASVSVSQNNAGENVARALKLKSAGGAIAQALMYTIGWVLPNHADQGELQDIPWAAMVGKRKKESGYGNAMGRGQYRWVTGKLVIPDKCGEVFGNSVTDCGNWIQNDIDSSNAAVSAYIQTLLFGLRAAKRLQHAIATSNRKPRLASSGKHVKFGTVVLPVVLRGKPHIGNSLKVDLGNVDYHWWTSQGEIFTGELNMHQLVSQLEPDDLGNKIILQKENKIVGVVVKVASLSVHRYLNLPANAFHALSLVKNSYFDTAKETEGESKSAHQKEIDSLREKFLERFNVLYAVEKLPNALITIMADLSKDYKMLTPKQDNLCGLKLWYAFRDLVSRVLFPLAYIGVIHPDLRPGWDVTSNILYKKHGQPDEKPVLQLVDFDSLVAYSDWSPPEPSFNVEGPKSKYLQFEKPCSKFTFLWWQCAMFAVAWRYGMAQVAVGEQNLLTTTFDDEEGNSALLDQLCGWNDVRTMTSSEFDKCLDCLGDVMFESVGCGKCEQCLARKMASL